MSYPLDEQGLSCFVQESNPHLEGRSLLSCPLNERSKSTQTDLNRPKKVLQTFPAARPCAHSGPGRIRTGAAGVKVLCLAAWRPGSVQVPHTVSGVRFGSRLLPPSRPQRHVRLPSVLYAAFSFFVRHPCRSHISRELPGIWAAGDSNPDLAD